MSERKGRTIWLSSEKARDKINKQCKPGETVEQMLRRKGVLK